jgi:hypothetical protein
METYYFLEKALRSLSKNEHKIFEKFLESEYFKKNHFCNNSLFVFYKKTTKYLLKNNIKESDWDLIISDIYKNEKIKLFRVKTKLKSELLSFFFDFIVNENLKNDKFLHHLIILKELSNRKLFYIFDHFSNSLRFNKISKDYEETELSYYLWKLFQLNNMQKERYAIQRNNLTNNSKNKNSVPSYTKMINDKHKYNSNDEIDYDTEIFLLNVLYKNELNKIQIRKNLSH